MTSQDKTAQLSSTYQLTRPNGTVLTGSNSLKLNVSGSKVGVKNPLYKDQIVRHLDATTPYSRVECLELTPASHYHALTYTPKTGGSYNTTQRTKWLTVTSAAAVDLALKDRALGILKRKLASAAMATPSLAPLAELRELRGLIRGLADTVTGKTLVEYAAARALADKRFPITGGRKSAMLDRHLYARRKFLASTWLQLNFGLKPMMSEVADVASAIASRLEGYPETERHVAVASKDWVTGGKYTVTNDAAYSRTIQSVNTRHTLSYMYIAGVAPKVLSGNDYTVADQFGFAWRELPGVAWELTPYSWLLDYFVNVGEYLGDTFECPPGFTTYITCTKRYTCETQEVPGEELYYQGVGVITGSNSSPGRFRYLSLTREKINSLPHIGLRIKSVDEVGANSVAKLINLLSVYIQRK